MAVNKSIDLPLSQEGAIAFLKSKFIPGIGEVYAGRIVDTLGEKLFDIANLVASDFQGVAGIGEKGGEAILSEIKKLPADPVFLIFLFSCGLLYQEINKIISRYGPHSKMVVTENPYDMVEDVWKFSFFKADKIGRLLGIPADDPRRIRGAILTAVKIFAEQGSLFANRDELTDLTSKITRTDKEKIPKEIDNLISEGRLIESLGGIYLPVYYKAEEETAKKIASIINDKSNSGDIEFDLPKEDLEGHVFTEEQLRAMRVVRDNPVSVITGDPGTGKTTTVRGLIKMFEDEGKKVILTAPTGRSTKKLETTAGASAKTIHRLLGFNRGKGYFNKKFEADVLIIDEASLLEQVLFNHLLQALPPKIKIVLVGDLGQLPPIGAGKVLEDIMESGVVPVAKLTHNFRQQKGSLLASNIQKIKKGEIPEGREGSDFMVFKESSPSKVRDKLMEVVTKLLPDKFGVDPSAIQVVSPQHDGILGTASLNEELQQHLNGNAPQICKGLKKFRLGDRVVQSENSGRRGVYNGETGKIIELDPDKGFMTVAFSDGKTSSYSSDDLRELSLAYATSVHKLQGTETDFVVMPLTMDHENMLYRNLLTTAVSRARKQCVIIGGEDAIKRAVERPAPYIRNSNLKSRLKALVKS